MENRVVIQKWEESERGWGVRPDGYSLHMSENDRRAFVQECWDKMPKGEAPDEYSREDGRPYEAVVDQKTYDSVKSSKNGIRVWGEVSMIFNCHVKRK